MQPTAQQIKQLRERVQDKRAMNITATQDYCASLIYAKRRMWQRWEAGSSKMPEASWELLEIKLSNIGVYSDVESTIKNRTGYTPKEMIASILNGDDLYLGDYRLGFDGVWFTIGNERLTDFYMSASVCISAMKKIKAR